MENSTQAARELEIVNDLGLHARAAAQFVQVANRFGADLKVKKDGVEVNGKSIMGVLMLAAGKGSRIVLEASGDDCDDLVDALGALVESGFGE